MDAELRTLIADSLKAKRKEGGFRSARAFAEKLGMSASKYTEYEQGRVALPYEAAWKMADALHCSLDELGGREWPRRGAPAPADPRLDGLVSIYGDLNEEGKERLADDADTMHASGKYDKKSDQLQMGNQEVA